MRSLAHLDNQEIRIASAPHAFFQSQQQSRQKGPIQINLLSILQN